MSKYKFNNKSFNTKKDVIIHFKSIKDKHSPNTKLKDKYYEDFCDVVELFKHHENHQEKLSDLSDIIIKKTPDNNQIAFYIIKSNSNEDTNISYRHIINNCLGNDKKQIHKKKQINNLKSSMRHSIIPQKNNFKKECNRLYCSFCGSGHNLEVDHVIEFKILYEKFLKQTKLKIPTEFDNCDKTHSAIFKKEDKEFNDAWYDFHLKNTSFRYLCKKCNCSRNKKKSKS